MSAKSRQLGGTRAVRLTNATLTLTGTPTTPGVQVPFGNTVALLQTGKLTDWVSTAEVWRPIGMGLMVTTSASTPGSVFTLNKAASSTSAANSYAAASSGGVTTVTAVTLTAPISLYLPFSSYLTTAGVSNFTADAAGDVWAVNVSTSPGAGAAHISLHYVLINSAGISDAVTTL
jgi:hypothetical protein